MKLIQAILLLLIRIYRAIVSPLLNAIFTPFGLGCRFTPTCSQYALEAVQKHGAWQGSLLATRRLCRCHPLGGEGYDPVPILNLNPNPNLNRSVRPTEVWQQARPATKES